MSERKRIEIDSLEELKQLIEEKDEDTMLVISLKKRNFRQPRNKFEKKKF